MELELFHKDKNPNENSYAIRLMLLSLPWIEVRSSKEGKTEVVATGQKDGHYQTNSEGSKGGRKAREKKEVVLPPSMVTHYHICRKSP
jgi:hypothetical protein